MYGAPGTDIPRHALKWSLHVWCLEAVGEGFTHDGAARNAVGAIAHQTQCANGHRDAVRAWHGAVAPDAADGAPLVVAERVGHQAVPVDLDGATQAAAPGDEGIQLLGVDGLEELLVAFENCADVRAAGHLGGHHTKRQQGAHLRNNRSMSIVTHHANRIVAPDAEQNGEVRGCATLDIRDEVVVGAEQPGAQPPVLLVRRVRLGHIFSVVRQRRSGNAGAEN